MRLQKTAPLIGEFQEYIERELVNALPKSALGKALNYTRKVLPRMKTLLLDGSLETDNNGAERAIKPFVIGHKNWLFSNTAKGAKSSASIYRIIETAKANGLIVEKYLVYLFDMLSKIDVTNKEIMLAIMPWPNDLPKELRASKRK
jgi:transposase